jgi:hypothetical protein
MTDIHESTLLYKLDLDSIHIDEVTGMNPKILEEIAGTDRIHVHIGNINVSMDIQGSIEALHIIPCDATRVVVNGLDIDFVIEATSADKVHWALVETTKIKFDDVVITMKNSYLQKLVNLSKKIIDKMIMDQMPKLIAAIDAKVKVINAMVAGETASTFVVPIGMVKGDEIDLNMTMTAAPFSDIDSKIINIFFNGMFVDKQVHTTIDDITSFPARREHVQSEQFWIHEDMLNSLF